MNLDGCVVVVTGASSGIGAAVSIELGRHGAVVGLILAAAIVWSRWQARSRLRVAGLTCSRWMFATATRSLMP